MPPSCKRIGILEVAASLTLLIALTALCTCADGFMFARLPEHHSAWRRLASFRSLSHVGGGLTIASFDGKMLTAHMVQHFCS